MEGRQAYVQDAGGSLVFEALRNVQRAASVRERLVANLGLDGSVPYGLIALAWMSDAS